MKKLLALLIVVTLMFGIGITAFADDEVCELSPEVSERLLEIKSEFIAEKVLDGSLDSESAEQMLAALETNSGNHTLRGLGFGSWLRESEYFDEVFDLMPNKNAGSRGSCSEDGNGFRRGGRGYKNQD